jgi:hypothetical protein
MNSKSRGRAGLGGVVLGLLGAVQLACGEASNHLSEDRGTGSGGETSGGGSGGESSRGGSSGSGAGGQPGGGGTTVGGSAGVGGDGGSPDSDPGTPNPPAISGGTLIALPDNLAVLSDPDRDRIVTVDVAGLTKLAEITLEPGAEPGRLVADAAGRVHVALRGTGELVTVDPVAGEILERRSVCRAPRGLAFDEPNDAIVLACLDGKLVELPAEGGEPIRTTTLDPDLRDVVFLGDGDTLVVTRFRSAEILYLDAERNVTQRQRPFADVTGLAATTAWRAVRTSTGRLLVAHHRAVTSNISLEPSCPGPGSEAFPCLEDVYGFKGPCNGPIVQATTTRADENGIVETYSSIPHVALPVDLAVSPEGVTAIANAARDPSYSWSSGYAFVFETRERRGSAAECAPDDSAYPYPANGPVTSVAFASDGSLLVLTREPSELAVFTISPELSELTDMAIIDLGGKVMTDKGHQLFHAQVGNGIACASCHAEGTDDGHVWQFDGLGARRTQPLDVELEGSAPFHWRGELASFGDLTNTVYRFMSGRSVSEEDSAALERYVYGLKRRPPVRSVADEAAARGKALFNSEEVGCASCHSGQRFSNGESEEVGKGAAVQVPSLLGVSVRGPFMHDGCAQTLLDTFDPTCGGDSHGHPELLDDAGRVDLIAYLETL